MTLASGERFFDHSRDSALTVDDMADEIPDVPLRVRCLGRPLGVADGANPGVELTNSAAVDRQQVHPIS
jgi:hypothetical protein